MQVNKDKVVSFHYQLFNEAGDEVESTLGAQPTLFLAGAGNTLPGLERALTGKKAGEKIKITLAPHEAYGIRKNNQQRISAKYLKHEGKLKPGQVVRLDSNKGVKVATVVKVGKFSVDVDLNHPLAGQRVTFDVEIVDIREATTEELSHGHAHGVGGHQH
jgi:FKBP-type peptidyl-prolyl cis-trans isomerase SlyD